MRQVLAQVVDKTPFNTISSLEAADHTPLSGCLVNSGHYLPSAADEGWHSPKSTYSTVAVQHFYRSNYVPYCNVQNSIWECSKNREPFSTDYYLSCIYTHMYKIIFYGSKQYKLWQVGAYLHRVWSTEAIFLVHFTVLVTVWCKTTHCLWPVSKNLRQS